MRISESLDPRLDAHSPFRMVVWVVGALVAVSMLLTTVALLLDLQHRSLVRNQSQFVVSLNLRSDASADVLETLVAQVAEIEGVSVIRAVPTEEISSVGSTGPSADARVDIRLPTVLQIQYSPENPPDRATIEAIFQETDPSARLRQFAQENGEQTRDLRIFQAIALGSMMLCFFALIGIVAIAANAALKSHHDTLDLLRTMGASDRDLAYQFEAKASGPLLLSVFAGFLLGLAASGLLLLAPIGRIAVEQGWSVIFHPLALVAVALIPAILGSSVVILGKFCARRYLGQMP